MGGINNRTLLIAAIMIGLGLIFTVKLFILQVHDPTYKFSAVSNTRRQVTQYPSRGLVYDRNGKLLVSNQAVYDVMVVPRDIVPFDSIDFCESLDLSIEQLRERFVQMRKDIRSRKISTYKPSVFLKQLSAEQYGEFQEKLYKFKGFFVQGRTLRKYEYPSAAHVLGYVGEISEGQLKKDAYYSQGDYVGISGIEQTYEQELRGKKGVKYMLVDVHGREKGAFRGGEHDTAAIAGKNITLSLDIELQQYGELLMQNKIGSIVAVEPSSGEILALVSAPNYDPSLLIGRDRSKNFPVLLTDSLKPLLNRAIQSAYPPGSTFKTINALIGLQEGTLKPYTTHECFMGYFARGLSVGCHLHDSPLNLAQSIQCSCNAYYCYELRNILDNPKYENIQESFNVWKDYLVKLGFGYRLGSDFKNEVRGFVPNADYFDKVYKKSWSSLTVISLSIGQGELLTTPLQMANMGAMIANRGHFLTPHIIKDIEDGEIDDRFTEKHETGIDIQHFAPIVNGMEMAVWGGAGSTARIAQVPGISICGKTGTAQNPHGDDHSIFMAFAPKDNPKIAIAVYVENGGFGARWGAPIASLMVEKYLTDSISTPYRQWIEKRMLEGDLINAEQKLQ
ncbi:penicillin-binding protein 2 [Carboxylicivirga sediminis]|uniref:Penicillin-binding protein 2 n=1 Tax=Carboxylicivirga sediminis TaxID=2006564 RepID=A0A941IYU6_9BACT|nr:penicillin-binding protein 2 [Carboxylicivirga sediminis]MBR8536864.1 penicillin-binding protein 2 [Carboxylicivirga sediminis]